MPRKKAMRPPTSARNWMPCCGKLVMTWDVQQSCLSSQLTFQCFILWQLLNTQKNGLFHLYLHFNLQFWGVQNGNDSPHLSPNLQIKMPKRKSKCEMEVLNTLLVLHRVEEELEHHHLDVLEVHPRGCHLVLVMSQALVSGYNPLSLSTGWPNWSRSWTTFCWHWNKKCVIL